MKKQNVLTGFIVLFLIGVLLLLKRFIWEPPIFCIDKFNPPSHWETHPEDRYCIMENILDNKLFLGQPVDSVFSKLGPKKDYDLGIPSKQNLWYFTTVGSVIGYYVLIIEVENGKVVGLDKHIE